MRGRNLRHVGLGADATYFAAKSKPLGAVMHMTRCREGVTVVEGCVAELVEAIDELAAEGSDLFPIPWGRLLFDQSLCSRCFGGRGVYCGRWRPCACAFRIEDLVTARPEEIRVEHLSLPLLCTDGGVGDVVLGPACYKHRRTLYVLLFDVVKTAILELEAARCALVANCNQEACTLLSWLAEDDINPGGAFHGMSGCVAAQLGGRADPRDCAADARRVADARAPERYAPESTPLPRI